MKIVADSPQIRTYDKAINIIIIDEIQYEVPFKKLKNFEIAVISAIKNTVM